MTADAAAIAQPGFPAAGLPPALTWGYLFPHDTAFECASGPAWFRDLLASRSSGREARVIAMSEEASRNLPDLGRWDGIVALNCPGITAERLRAAGFAYTRRFAVLPSAAMVRWFIPIDCSRRATAASFGIYTPTRTSARVKLELARSAALLGLPGWYRDTMVVASRRIPGLERAVQPLFPGRDFRLAISSGSPGPARNRKASAVVVETSTARILGFVKIGGSEFSRSSLQREAAAVSALSGLAGAAPRLIYVGEVDGRYVTVQSPLHGRPAPAALTSQHLSFLERLQGSPKLASTTAMFSALAARIEALDRFRPELAAAFARVVPELQDVVVPATIVHGDFAPWNLRSQSGRIVAFDWENAELDGLPLIDETHFRVQLCHQLRDWNPSRFHAHLMELAAARPLGLQQDQVSAIYKFYTLDWLVRLIEEGYPLQNCTVMWYADLLARLDGSGWRLGDGTLWTGRLPRSPLAPS